MTKEAALYSFFSGFGIPAYAETDVPNNAVLPYLTYTPVFDAWGGDAAALTVNLWYYGAGETAPNAKAAEISKAIGPGGKVLGCEGGYIWLRRGTPWCQSAPMEDEPLLKMKTLNLSAEYLTLN